MFFKRFIFDTDTYQYVRYRWSARDWWVRISGVLAGGVLVSALFLGVTLTQVGNLEEMVLLEERNELVREVAWQLDELSEQEKRLALLHEKDNTFFRSILNHPPIDAAVWHGGMGGSEVAPARNESVAAAQQKIQLLQYRIQLQHASFDTLNNLAVSKKDELQHIPAIRPCMGRVGSGFGPRSNPFHGGPEFHPGLDFFAPIGTPIYAAGDGVVVKAGAPQSGYGLQVEIDHGYGFKTKYAHMSQVKVNLGDTITRNQLIGLVGSTGYSTGPHLHYEVIRNEKKINPIDFFYTNN